VEVCVKRLTWENATDAYYTTEVANNLFYASLHSTLQRVHEMKTTVHWYCKLGFGNINHSGYCLAKHLDVKKLMWFQLR